MGAIASGHAVLVIDEENGVSPGLNQTKQEADEVVEIAEADVAATTGLRRESQNCSTREDH